jgi:hypothetical protein
VVARYAGRPLRDVLAELQGQGLGMIYSSDLVRPDMLVASEPRATEPRLLLAELLAPHGLETREGPGGILLIVRGAAAPDPGGHRAEERRRAPAPPPGPLRSGLDEEVVVSGSGAERDPPPAETTTISGADLLRDATLGDDAQRALSRQIGTAGGDRSAELFVRGGAEDELAVVLDGLRIREPFHLNRFLSPSGIIDANAIDAAEFSSGNFPAEVGDTLSGVVSLFSSAPSGPPRMSLEASALNLRLRTDGLFASGDGQWLVTGRRFYPDAALDMGNPAMDDISPRYSDLFAKARLRVGEGTVLSGDVLVSGDSIDFSGDPTRVVRAESASRHAWLEVKSALTPRLLSETTFASGSIESSRAGSLGGTPATALVDDRRSFDYLSARQGFSWQVSAGQELRGGLSVEHGDAEYDVVRQPESPAPMPGAAAIPSGPQPRLVAQPSGYTLGAYVADRLRLSSSMTAEVGLRWDAQTYTADRQLSPRVNLVQRLGGGSLWRAGWGRYYQSQGLDELQVEDGVSHFFPAQLAEQAMLGFEQPLTPRLSLRIDAYRKEMSQLRPRFENLFNPFELFPELATDRVRIDPSRAEARGVEISLHGDGGPGFGWWAGYARASARDEIDGRWIARSWDQRDTFNFGVGYRRGSTWELSLAGQYHSGWPTTGVSAIPITNPDGTAGIEPILGPRNAERFPAFHRLDLTVRRAFQIGRGRLSLFAEITNLYNRDNVCCAEGFRFTPGSDGEVRVDRVDGFWLQQVPVFGIAWDSAP